jgi:hypothetical protein
MYSLTRSLRLPLLHPKLLAPANMDSQLVQALALHMVIFSSFLFPERFLFSSCCAKELLLGAGAVGAGAVGAGGDHCAGCAQPITEGKSVRTGGKAYHLDCLNCTRCYCNLANGSAIASLGKNEKYLEIRSSKKKY